MAALAAVPVFLGRTNRENRRIAGWRPGAPPRDWDRVRARWELSHGARALLFPVAIGLPLGALLAV